MFGRIAADESPIKIVYEVRCAPVEMREDGRGARGDEAADHQSQKPVRQERQHRRKGDIVPEQPRLQIRKRRLNIRQLRIDDERAQRDENPWPWTEDVVCDVEEEDGAQR